MIWRFAKYFLRHGRQPFAGPDCCRVSRTGEFRGETAPSEMCVSEVLSQLLADLFSVPSHVLLASTGLYISRPARIYYHIVHMLTYRGIWVAFDGGVPLYHRGLLPSHPGRARR